MECENSSWKEYSREKELESSGLERLVRYIEKEKELNNESKGFTSSLFFMRKNTNSDDSIEGIFHYKHLALL